jgi:hypothetical protein
MKNADGIAHKYGVDRFAKVYEELDQALDFANDALVEGEVISEELKKQ